MEKSETPTMDKYLTPTQKSEMIDLAKRQGDSLALADNPRFSLETQQVIGIIIAPLSDKDKLRVLAHIRDYVEMRQRHKKENAPFG